MNRCAEAAAVAATVPGSGVGDAGLRPPMVPRQASFFPPPVPNPFVQQTKISAARRLQVEARRAPVVAMWCDGGGSGRGHLVGGGSVLRGSGLRGEVSEEKAGLMDGASERIANLKGVGGSRQSDTPRA